MTIPQYDNYVWRQTGPGRWERNIDEAEQFYTTMAKVYEGSGRVFFAMTGHISLSVDVAESSSHERTEEGVKEALRRAWLQLRHDHPTIASKVEYNQTEGQCKKVYETFQPDGATEDSWLETTFCVMSNGLTGMEWCNFDPPVPNIPTIFLLKTPASVHSDDKVHYDLVLRCHHDIIDGIGTLHLLNNLFKHAAKIYAHPSASRPTFGEEWKNLSPPLRVAASIPAELNAEQQAQYDEIMKYNASLESDIEIASLPFRAGAVLPGTHQRVDLTLSQDKTLRVLGACKRLGISVTHAYHAGIAMTVRDLQQRKQDARMVRYINYCLINERSHCQAPYNTPSHAASVYHSVSGRSLIVDLQVPGFLERIDGENATLATEEFKRVALEIRGHYVEIRDDKDNMPKVPHYWVKGTPPYPDPSRVPPVPRPSPNPSVSISSMGAIDQIITPRQGVFELDNPWVTGEELGTGLGVFLGTFRGQLTLSAAFNDVWHDKEEAMRFLTRCDEVVRQGLGV